MQPALLSRQDLDLSIVHDCKANLFYLPVICCAEQDRLEVRRETNEQDKHLDVISDALNDLQRIGEVSAATASSLSIWLTSCMCA